MENESMSSMKNDVLNPTPLIRNRFSYLLYNKAESSGECALNSNLHISRKAEIYLV